MLVQYRTECISSESQLVSHGMNYSFGMCFALGLQSLSCDMTQFSRQYHNSWKHSQKRGKAVKLRKRPWGFLRNKWKGNTPLCEKIFRTRSVLNLQYANVYVTGATCWQDACVHFIVTDVTQSSFCCLLTFAAFILYWIQKTTVVV